MIIDLEVVFGKLEKNPGGFSSRELAESMGCSICTARTRIREKVLAGELVFLGKRIEQNVMGGNCRVGVYGPPRADKS